MNSDRVFDFLSRFTEWLPYHHHVQAEINGVNVPLPINFNSIDLLFEPKEAIALKTELETLYGFGANVPILQLRESSSQKVRAFAEFVFEHVFLHYTVKMWGITPEEIDPAVTARIPIRLSYDDRHFLHKYQVMPKEGFTALFRRMLDHPAIVLHLETDSRDVLRFDSASKTVFYRGKEWDGLLIYTGALDELFGYCFGELPYRSLRFEFEHHAARTIQDATVLNWPDSRPATRRTEMTRLTQQRMTEPMTTTIVEYPGAYDRASSDYSEPYYPILAPKCQQLYLRYRTYFEAFPRCKLVGRLAEYRYYNMEATILAAFGLVDSI